MLIGLISLSADAWMSLSAGPMDGALLTCSGE